jgi:drug/metabolite transporter (DMT)-like permease
LKGTRLKARDMGVWAALASAVLFGAGTPLAKALLDVQSGSISPWLLAGLLYAGSGIGLLIYRQFKRLPSPLLVGNEQLWLLAAVVCGGAIAPVLLMFGLSQLAASHASLLLNAEAVLTTLLAWALFKEHLGQRIVWGMALIVAGALLLSWPSGGLRTAAPAAMLWPALAVVLACAFWALDNNFTRKVAHADASWIACIKGLAAGFTNLLLAFFVGASLPSLAGVSAAMTVGFFAYGVSLALFVVALRHLGASRAGAYFSAAPFVGAVLSVVLFAEPVTWQLLTAGLLMGAGVWLHLTEHHAHPHVHAAHTHTHVHTHDGDLHHLHDHAEGVEHSDSVDPLKPHTHTHHHEAMTHDHAHYPDAHHRHGH